MKHPWHLHFILMLQILSLTGLTAQTVQFRGPDRTGIYQTGELWDSWPEEGPPLVATIRGIGDGFSAPAINDRGVFVSGMIDSTGYMFHFDHEQNPVWQVSYGREFAFKYTGARATPTLEGNRLYYAGTFGDAFCLDIRTGSYLWKRNLFGDFGGKEIKWGYTESPLIYKDKLILTPGGKGHNVVALGKMTGDLVWSLELDSARNAYCSPVLIRHNGRDLILMNTTGYLLLIDPGKGKAIFRHPIAHSNNMHAVTPLYLDGKIFYTCGYGQGSVLFDINPATKRLDTIYHNSDLDSRLSGLIPYKGTVYGTSHRKKQWVGVDLRSGETVFTTRAVKPGTFLLADDKFFIFTENGNAALADPGPDGFSIVSRFPVPAEQIQYAFAHPVLRNGILYIRYREHLWLYRVGGDRQPGPFKTQ